jgi:hypothetical protein
MRFVSSELPTKELDLLNSIRGCGNGDEVDLFTAYNHLVYHLNGSFYFQRIVEGIVDTVKADMMTPRNYLCTAYEVLDSSVDVRSKIEEQFQTRHGFAMTSEIVWLSVTFKGRAYILAKLPTRLVRDLMRGAGGVLKTIVSGPVGCLRRIPMLALYGNLPTGVADDFIHKAVFATTYGDGQHAEALHIHYLLLQDVINHPSLGIAVGGVGLWDAD